MVDVERLAPSGKEVVEYDRLNLALYAALLDAADAGEDWCASATQLMGLDLTAPDAEACWRSHLDRARWIVGDGLAAAISAFNKRPAFTVPANRQGGN